MRLLVSSIDQPWLRAKFIEERDQQDEVERVRTAVSAHTEMRLGGDGSTFRVTPSNGPNLRFSVLPNETVPLDRFNVVMRYLPGAVVPCLRTRVADFNLYRLLRAKTAVCALRPRVRNA